MIPSEGSRPAGTSQKLRIVFTPMPTREGHLISGVTVFGCTTGAGAGFFAGGGFRFCAASGAARRSAIRNDVTTRRMSQYIVRGPMTDDRWSMVDGRWSMCSERCHRFQSDASSTAHRSSTIVHRSSDVDQRSGGDDVEELVHAFRQRRWTRLEDVRGLDLVDAIVAHRVDRVPAGPLDDRALLHRLAAPGCDDDVGVALDDEPRIDDAILAERLVAELGKDRTSARDLDELFHPADARDEGIVPLLEEDSGPPTRLRRFRGPGTRDRIRPGLPRDLVQLSFDP